MKTPLAPPSLSGAPLIDAYLPALPTEPGVYRMIGEHGELLYVGKAKNLKKRVHSYTQPQRLSNRLQRMVRETQAMEFISTNTEIEALLLEANLIKKLSPKYNILLKDDKFFAYIALTHHPFPQLMKFRGVKNKKDRYFGPFASTEAVYQSLDLLYRIFRLRSCSDRFFATRKRPCLQYHIKRCSAPCVGYISQQDYQAAIEHTVQFLKGKSQELKKDLAVLMTEASEKLAFEKAAFYRDQIRALTHIQSHQDIYVQAVGDADVFGMVRQGERVCIQVFFFRGSSNFGSMSLFLQHVDDMNDSPILTQFLSLFYSDKIPPKEILLSHSLSSSDHSLLESALSSQTGYSVLLKTPLRGRKKDLVQNALKNAAQALYRKNRESENQALYLKELGTYLGLPHSLERIEIYDNSHLQGSHQVSAMVVATSQGFDKKAYRKFIIRQTETPGDDYAMMKEVLRRRFTSYLSTDLWKNQKPNLVIIDGGKGHLTAVLEVFKELGLSLPVLAIAKGPQRQADLETFYMKDRAPFSLDLHKTLLYFLQRLRDEAHRFAIGTHRAQRLKKMGVSILDQVPGIGSKRKKELLRYFGSPQGIQNASIKELQRVKGISETLAKSLYTYFHPSEEGGIS